jgi:hypothetical protein
MSRTSLSIVLSIVSLTNLLNIPVSAQTGPTNPEKWEYKVSNGCFNESDLNKQGDEGWELIGMTFNSDGNCRGSYFKRPKKEFFNPPPAAPTPAGPPRCNLTLAQAPIFRGIRLGMSTDELLDLFPRSKEQLEIIKRLSEAKIFFGRTDLSFSQNTYPENDAMFGNSVSVYQITMLDGRVTSINVQYSFQGNFYWTDKTWIPKVSEAYNLPKPEDWQGNSLTCQGFKITAGGNNTFAHFNLSGPDANREVRQRSEAFSEKLRTEFKP